MPTSGYEVEAWSDSCLYTRLKSAFYLPIRLLRNVICSIDVPNSMNFRNQSCLVDRMLPVSSQHLPPTLSVATMSGASRLLLLWIILKVQAAERKLKSLDNIEKEKRKPTRSSR